MYSVYMCVICYTMKYDNNYGETIVTILACSSVDCNNLFNNNRSKHAC